MRISGSGSTKKKNMIVDSSLVSVSLSILRSTNPSFRLGISMPATVILVVKQR